MNNLSKRDLLAKEHAPYASGNTTNSKQSFQAGWDARGSDIKLLKHQLEKLIDTIVQTTDNNECIDESEALLRVIE